MLRVNNRNGTLVNRDAFGGLTVFVTLNTFCLVLFRVELSPEVPAEGPGAALYILQTVECGPVNSLSR